jgi:NAD(P)H dehydrogenase (quinone)
MLSHFQTEEYLIKSGLKYTILRNTMYADAL